MRRLVLAALAVLLSAGVAGAQTDLTHEQINIPGTNTSGFRIHGNTSTVNVTVAGVIAATGGYKVAFPFAHTGSSIVAALTNSAVPVVGSVSGNITGGGQSGVLYYRTPTAGSIVAISIMASTALTTQASAHAEAVVIAGMSTTRRTGFTTVIGATLTNTQYGSATAARGTYNFTASEGVGCNVSTSTVVTPLTARLTCTLIVEM